MKYPLSFQFFKIYSLNAYQEPLKYSSRKQSKDKHSWNGWNRIKGQIIKRSYALGHY